MQYFNQSLQPIKYLNYQDYMYLKPETPQDLLIEKVSLQEPKNHSKQKRPNNYRKRNGNKHSSSSSSSSPNKSHDKRQKKPLTEDEKIQKRSRILAKIYGAHENLTEFIKKTINERMGYCIKAFATENKIERKINPEKAQMIKNKLMSFLGKSQAEVDEIIKKCPNMNFKHICWFLKGQGTVNFQVQDFKNFKLKFRAEKCQKKNWKSKYTEGETKLWKQAKQLRRAEKCQKRAKRHQKEESVEKKQTADETAQEEATKLSIEDVIRFGPALINVKKQLGSEKTIKLFKFINKNQCLTEQALIQKWTNKK